MLDVLDLLRPYYLLPLGFGLGMVTANFMGKDKFHALFWGTLALSLGLTLLARTAMVRSIEIQHWTAAEASGILMTFFSAPLFGAFGLCLFLAMMKAASWLRRRSMRS